MTNPGGEAPEGTVGADLAPITGITKESWRFALDQHIEPWRGAQASLNTAMGTVQSNISDFADGQLALNNRTDLLKQVSGYATVFLGRNWDLPPNAPVVLPFNRQLGPLKNTGVNEADGIILKAKGLWRVEAHMTLKSSVMYTQVTYSTGPFGIPIPVFTPYYMPVGTRFRIEVIRLGDGQLLSVTTYNTMPDGRMGQPGLTAPQSSAFNHTFVVDIDPDDGNTWCLVRLAALAVPGPATLGHWEGTPAVFVCKAYGGTALSSLTAARWSVDTDHDEFLPDAPDGGTL